MGTYDPNRYYQDANGRWWFRTADSAAYSRRPARLVECPGCGKARPMKNTRANRDSPGWCRACFNVRTYDLRNSPIGAVRNEQGYLVERVADDDPLVCMASGRNGYGRKNNRWIRQHRLVMARAIGRPLSRSETVHHINGERHNNQLENLQLRSGHHGQGAIAYCADCGSNHIEYRGIGQLQETLL
jgi:hypothetical protein